MSTQLNTLGSIALAEFLGTTNQLIHYLSKMTAFKEQMFLFAKNMEFISESRRAEINLKIFIFLIKI